MQCKLPVSPFTAMDFLIKEFSPTLQANLWDEELSDSCSHLSSLTSLPQNGLQKPVPKAKQPSTLRVPTAFMLPPFV